MRTDVEIYLDTMIEEKLWSNKGNLQFYLDTLFEGTDFRNKKILDIGGGAGLLSFYAASSGANEVVCLEPEAQGSSSGITEKFQRVRSQLKDCNVILKPITLQQFESDGKTFDIIILHDSINHLDEEACISLLKNEGSQAIYREIFLKIYSLSNEGAKLVISDCSRYNFFAFVGINNPMAPTIGWHKHQSPELWADLLGNVGFVKPNIRWLSFNRLRYWGKLILGNKPMAWFLISYFCLTMEKSRI